MYIACKSKLSTLLPSFQFERGARPKVEFRTATKQKPAHALLIHLHLRHKSTAFFCYRLDLSVCFGRTKLSCGNVTNSTCRYRLLRCN